MNATNTFIFTKKNVEPQEYLIHKMVYNIGQIHEFSVSKIFNYDETTKTLQMQKIPFLNISDQYGEKSSDIPVHIFEKIRKIIQILYCAQIEYPDITGYNFIENKTNGKITIIDFEHARCCNKPIQNKFIKKFIRGFNGWNPEFT
jgi:tRNA A-37 threonylcarbamoyl transferase component Bud32